MSPASLDALLRDVPLPDGFVERLKVSLSHEIVPDDEHVDSALRSVEVPDAVLLRLREIPDEEQLDEALVDIPAPPALIYSLRRRTWGERMRWAGRRVARLTMAASWFLAISVSLAGMLAALVAGVQPRGEDDFGMVVIYDGPFAFEGQPQPAELTIRMRPEPEPLGDVYWTAFVPAQSESQRRPRDEWPIARISQPEPADPPPPAGPVGQWTELLASGLRPMDDAVLLRYGVLGSPQYADDRLPELVAPRPPQPAGIEPPPVRGYDRAFFLKNRVFPLISPAANPKLASAAVPLVAASDVLSQIERQLAEGRLPPASEIRTEDFLAAMDYRLPEAPAGRLALRTAAGPSLFGAPNANLLQVAVQAGRFANRPQPATHLVLAIDLSHSMGSAGRLEMVQAAFDRLLGQLDPRDRLSLVVFHEQVIHVVEEAGSEDADSLRELMANLVPRGGTNLAAGVQQGAALAMSGSAERARRLVLITDSQATVSAQARHGIEQILAAAGESGVRLDVLDVSHRGTVDPLLADWATRLSGEARPVEATRDLTWSLLSALSGGDAEVAREAKLTLRFNPRAVAAYRLIGHEANALAEVTPADVVCDLAAGESASALVELWLQGDADDVGQAELTWIDPATGQPQRLTQRISRVQFAASLEEMPLPLAQAALAAQVGEILRGAHDVLRQSGVRPATSRGLADVAATARRLNPRLHERPDVQRLIELIERLRAQGVR